MRIELAICDLLYGEAKLLTSIPLSDACERSSKRDIAEAGPRNSRRCGSSRHRQRRIGTASATYDESCGVLRSKDLSIDPVHSTIPSPDPLNGRPWMAEFALRLASAADTLEPWAADRLSKGLEFLLKYNTIFRAARFIVLAGDVRVGPRPLSAGALHEQWEWVLLTARNKTIIGGLAGASETSARRLLECFGSRTPPPVVAV